MPSDKTHLLLQWCSEHGLRIDPRLQVVQDDRTGIRVVATAEIPFPSTREPPHSYTRSAPAFGGADEDPSGRKSKLFTSPSPRCSLSVHVHSRSSWQICTRRTDKARNWRWRSPFTARSCAAPTRCGSVTCNRCPQNPSSLHSYGAQKPRSLTHPPLMRSPRASGTMRTADLYKTATAARGISSRKPRERHRMTGNLPRHNARRSKTAGKHDAGSEEPRSKPSSVGKTTRACRSWYEPARNSSVRWPGVPASLTPLPARVGQEAVRGFYHTTAAPLLSGPGLRAQLPADAPPPRLGAFYHAYTLVSSRAFLIDAYHGLAMVPIADA